MFKFSFRIDISRKSLFKHLKVVFFILSVLLLNVAVGAASSETSIKNKIKAVTAQQVHHQIEIQIQGSQEPAYTVYELFSPPRVIVDVADSELTDSLTFESETNVPVSLTTKSIDATPPLTRFEFTLTESLPFQASRLENNIIITLDVRAANDTDTFDLERQESGLASVVSDIDVTSTATETIVSLQANGKIDDFAYDVLDMDEENPPRLYIDVNNVSGEELLREQNVGTILNRIRVAKRDSGIRVVFDSSQDTLFSFKLSETENGLKLTITEPDQRVDRISSLINQRQAIDEQLPRSPIMDHRDTSEEDVDYVSEEDSSEDTASQKMKDNFSFAGYKKKRITVDFYKIDLHNVFRLIKDISGQNLVVDEGVSGVLTLALNDVPWDFALDIIINLTGLQKEERFNTIVILPKNKEFSWPERSEDNLSFEAVEEIAVKEAIVIQQRLNLPKTVIEAKKLITEGRKLEDNGDYESAVTTYKAALSKWPQNADLANKISSLYLVQLRQNASAVHFAKKALQINPEEAKASLNAAIGLANMQKRQEAQQYFDQSVSGESPVREALLSYAVFSEEHKVYDAAIRILAKHDRIYGENLDSMLAQARILDKLGHSEDASEKYQSILLSGFRVPPDLKKYINGRIAFSQQQ